MRLHILSYIFILYIEFVPYSCTNVNSNDSGLKDSVSVVKDSIYTPYSKEKNTYSGFDSPNAINAIAKIENEYFNDYKKGVSKYYGTNWYYTSQCNIDSITGLSQWDKYLKEIQSKGIKPDSFHCTIYAVKALEAGMGKDFEKLKELHKKQYRNHEFAGWSVAYLLTNYFNWKAYLIAMKYSSEYKKCTTNFRSRKCYDVWHQPDIHLEKMFVIGNDDKAIDSLLNQNEFGWGFSNQGTHTWITRFNQLKECRWEGVPSKKYDYCDNCLPLFKIHNFLDYLEYDIHIVVFPPKLKDNID